MLQDMKHNPYVKEILILELYSLTETDNAQCFIKLLYIQSEILQ